MPPLFFVPGAQAVTAELLKEHGLDHLLGSVEHRHTFSGPPGGVAGLLIANNDCPVERLCFDDAKQTWSKRFGLTSLVGTWNDAPTSPAELVREKLLAGSDVKLLDGEHWHVPVLRRYREEAVLQFKCELPRVMQQCTETGKWILGNVVPKYKELWDESIAIASTLFQQLQGSTTAELEWKQVFDFAVKLLAVNYRVDASVLSHLQNLHPDIAGDIVQAALDWPSMRAHLKNELSRLTPGGSTSESGATRPTEA